MLSDKSINLSASETTLTSHATNAKSEKAATNVMIDFVAKHIEKQKIKQADANKKLKGEVLKSILLSESDKVEPKIKEGYFKLIKNQKTERLNRFEYDRFREIASASNVAHSAYLQNNHKKVMEDLFLRIEKQKMKQAWDVNKKLKGGVFKSILLAESDKVEPKIKEGYFKLIENQKTEQFNRFEYDRFREIASPSNVAHSAYLQNNHKKVMEDLFLRAAIKKQAADSIIQSRNLFRGGLETGNQNVKGKCIAKDHTKKLLEKSLKDIKDGLAQGDTSERDRILRQYRSSLGLGRKKEEAVIKR